MREITKSAVSLSWALSLLGIKQSLNLFTPAAQGQAGGANSFEPVAQTAVGQLGASLQGIYRTGDSLQRGMVDIMFGMFNPANWNPAAWMPGAGSPPAGGGPSQSWGPVPPAPGR